MSDIKLGLFPVENSQRDAIHIAVVPVVSEENLYPGDRVALVAGTTHKVQSLRGAENEMGIGIVDPFLSKRIYAGQRFWLLLYPHTITSLRHEWTHPAFEAVEHTVKKSHEWLAEKAVRLGVPLEELLYAATNGGCFGQDLDGDSQIEPELWEHIKVVTGKTVPVVDRPTHFRCAC